MNFKIRTAKPEDLPEIMEVERNSFIPEIQEKESVFLERIETFSEGFLIFEVEEAEDKRIAGYFSTELWDEVPERKESFVIGHSIKDVHNDRGTALYISSFAILPEFRGNGNGKRLFSEALDFIEKNNKLEKLVLMVNELWAGAYHIYSLYGFREIFRIEDIFSGEKGSSSGGIVMTCNV